MIYLDNAATTLQKPAAVRRAMQWAAENCANPGRGGHAPAMRAADVLFQLREEAAALFDAAPEQVVLTTNATHGLNLAIRTLIRSGDRVVISGFEHNAVTRPLALIGAKPVAASMALFDPVRTLADFDDALRCRPAAVIVNHASNVFGYVQPLSELAALCRTRGLHLIVDASQSAGIEPLSLRGLGADFIAMPGHKALYGPQGTGLLLCGTLPEPLLAGGTGSLSERSEMPDFLPDRVEAGTPNVPGAAGLLQGLRFVRRMGTARIAAAERHMCRLLCDGLAAIPGVRVYDGGASQSGVVSFLIEGVEFDTLAAAYAKEGSALRAGLHCAPLAHKSAGTLETGTLRASVSVFNGEMQLRRFLQTTAKLAVAARTPSGRGTERYS